MFEGITHFFKRFKKSEKLESKSTAKERLHLVLAQDRANISADFLEMMKQEILEVIKKYIDIDEKAIDVRLTNKESEDGSVGAPALYANIPIITIKNEARKLEGALEKEKNSKKENNEVITGTVDTPENEVKVQDNKVEEETQGRVKNNSEAVLSQEIDENITKTSNEKTDTEQDDTSTKSKNQVENKAKNSEINDVKEDQSKSENDNMDEVDNEEKNS